MDDLLVAGLLVAGLVILTPLSDRLRVPLPVALTIYGLIIAALPGAPTVHIEPDLILPLVLPPLLFAATQRSSAREFAESARPILLLAVGLTVATTGVVTVVAHTAGLAWGPAFVLGAVVAPPDPVAATAVARRLRLPHRLVTVLEGEGMFNDATALVLYKVAVAVVVTGHLSPAKAVGELLAAVVIGVAVGGLVGALTRRALAVLHDATAETTVTAVAPFAAYLLAEQLQGSGVLGVLVLGLFLRSYGHSAITAGGWLLGRAVWNYADYCITSAVFLLIGFELTEVLTSSGVGWESAGLLVSILATVVAFRFVWLFPAAWLSARRTAHPPATPFGWRETTVAGWAGMRGVVTVATALALPLTVDDASGFPDREVVVLVALVCVLVTLVAQGLTLAPLVRRLDVGEEGHLDQEVTLLRKEAAQAALRTVRDAGTQLPAPVRDAAVAQYEGYLAAQAALDSARVGATDDDDGYPDLLESLLRQASEAERGVALAARKDGRFSAAAVDEVLQDIESRAVRDYD